MIPRVSIPPSVAIQQRPQHMSSMRAPHGGDFFRRAAGDDATAMRAAFGPEIDDVSRRS